MDVRSSRLIENPSAAPPLAARPILDRHALATLLTSTLLLLIWFTYYYYGVLEKLGRLTIPMSRSNRVSTLPLWWRCLAMFNWRPDYGI